MLKALRRPPLRRLWFGQALSSVGDEIYRVGLTWLAVGRIGADTGYLNAAQAAALMVLSFVGGKWADRWDPLRTMVRVDFLRAGIVLIPVAVSFFMPVPLALVVVVAVLLSGLGAFFDPAMQTVLPKFSPDVATLRAATGLMSTTTRLARMVGPGLVGILAGLIPVIHFFTLDALSFLISAASVRPLQAPPPRESSLRKRRISFEEAIFAGFEALRRKEGMTFILISKALTGATWNLTYGLGLALTVQKLAPHDTRSFGLVIASYGVGNFAGALYFGNLHRRRPARMMCVGYVWLGLGFIATAFCSNLNALMLILAVTGFSGTMNELTFYDLVQVRFDLAEMTRIFRLRMATDTLATLLLLLVSPLLFRALGVSAVIGLSGGLWVVVGAVGLTNVTARLDGAV